MITLKEILDKLNIEGSKKEAHDNAYPSGVFVDEKATRGKVSDYLKKCLKDNKRLTLDLIDRILNDDVGLFYHYSHSLRESIKPTHSEYDYIGVYEDGSVAIWCETDGFVAFLHDYLKTWFGTEQYKLLEPFLEAIKP